MNTLLKILSKTQFGFVTKQDLETLEQDMPDLPLLLRFGCGRKVVEACRVRQTIESTEAHGDYLRDVSLASQTIDQMAESPFISAAVKNAINSMRTW